MTLRKKSLLIFGLLVTGLIGVVYPTSQSILLNQYASLEEDEDGRNLDRVTLAIQQELAQMDRSANDLLDLSRLDSGDLELSLGEAEPSIIVRELSDVCASEAAQKGIEFFTNVADNTPNVVIDEGRFRQVAISLVSNAVKFTQDGRIDIDLSVVPNEGNETGTLSLAVKDTGVGIAPDQLKRIFGAFDQQHGQSINEYGGMGVGLSQRVANLLNARIDVQSEVDRGTTFTFTIPDVKLIAPPVPATLQDEIDDELMAINDLEDFARQIQEVAESYGFPPLRRWAERLSLQLSQFELDAIPTTLNNFSRLLEQVRDHARGPENA